MKYPPKSFGRVIECLSLYTGNPNDMAHTCQIGDGRVTHYGSLVATFTWPDDNPLFDFVEPRYQEQQFRLRPFLDLPMAKYYINWAVQCVRECLTFDEAMAIRHVRDVLNGDWNLITVKEETLAKISRVLCLATQRELPRSVEDSQHFAMCAIYSVPPTLKYPPGIYRYKGPGWTKEINVEVTATHIQMSPERRPIPLREIPAGATLRPLKLDDIPQVPEQYFTICVSGSPAVVSPILGPTPRTPSEILDLYAEQYGMDRKTLSWSIVRPIPMPEPQDKGA